MLQHSHDHQVKWVSNALKPGTVRKNHFNVSGFVALAMPPIQNRRMSSQQGVFLFNGAEDLTFQESLDTMMNGRKSWCRRFEIPGKALPEVERRLFQMNIHELSLFPDIEGLSGFIRQRIRLHWFHD